MTKLNKTKAFLNTSIKSVDEQEDESIVIKGYANTVAKDRAGDVIPKSAWEKPKAMKNYKKNPIILANHKYDEPIGLMTDYEITDKGLHITAKISKAAGKYHTLIKEGILKTFSVGFGIHDAEYDRDSDTFEIKELELFEVSVVAVPCNQDSTFSIAKGMDADSFSEFKQQFINEEKSQPTEVDTKENSQMSDFNLDELLARMGEVAGTAAKDALSAEKEAERKAAEAKAAKEAAEKARKEEAAKAAKEAAEALVTELEGKLEKSATAFAKTVEAQQETIAQLQDEIKQVVASRNSDKGVFSAAADAVKNALQPEMEKEVGDVVLLGMVAKKDMFETKFGKAHYEKAVNSSSSIQVSQDAYETLFSTNLMKEIEGKLVLAPLFREIQMNEANMTLPIVPHSGKADWVAAAQVRGGASRDKSTTGTEKKLTLTDVTLKTFKLAAKSFITDETTEDAIIPLLDLIRTNLVESHANAIEEMILRGDGANKPKGLIPLASDINGDANAKDKFGGVAATEATHTGTVKVTAKMIHQARRKLGLYGMDISKVALVISHSAYWDLLEDDEFANIDQVGASNAVKLTGQVGSIYGLPVIVATSNYCFEAPAAGKAFGVIVYRDNFVMPRQRTMTMQTDYYVEEQQRVLVSTQRIGFQELFVKRGVVSIHYKS